MRFRGVGAGEQWDHVPSPSDLIVQYMRMQAEVARAPKPTTPAVAWAALANEISVLDAQVTELVDTLELDGAGRLVGAAPREQPPAASALDHAGRPLVMSIPASALLTEERVRFALKHFVSAPAFEKMLKKGGFKLPKHFLFSLYLLYQRFGAGREYAHPLWQAWIAAHDVARTGEDALHFWSDAELALLEDERLIEMAAESRRGIADHYEKLLRPLCEMFPYFFPPDEIGEAEYARAVALAGAQLVEVPAITGRALLPLPLRHSPAGTVKPSHVAQTVGKDGAEQRIVNLVHRGGGDGGGGGGGSGGGGFTAATAATAAAAAAAAATAVGVEVTWRASEEAGHETRHNDQLLLEGGYLWDALACASVPLRFVIDVDKTDEASARKRLLKRARYKGEYDYTATTAPLPVELMQWSRVLLCSGEELAQMGVRDAAAATDATVDAALEAMRRPLSLQTEVEVIGNLVNGMHRIFAQHDHDVEEDELILATNRRDSVGLSARARMAVQHRRLSKIVLTRQMESLGAQLEEAENRQRRQANTGSYSTASERKRKAKKKSEKELQRERTRAAREKKKREKSEL